MDAMKATHRRGSSRASSRKSPRVRRHSVRSARATGRAGLPPTREAQFRELELRVARLEAEKLELRNACHRLEAAGLSRAKLRDFAPVGLVTLDAQGTILDINRAGAALLGRGRWSLIKQRFVALVAPEDRSIFSADLRRCVRLRVMVSGELGLRRAEGGLVAVQFAGMPVLDQRARVVQVETTLVDITDRRRAERALRESEARLKAIMENSPAMIFLKDTQGRYLHFNREFGHVFGLGLEQTVGKTDAEIFPPKPAALYRANDLKVLEAGVPMVFDEFAYHDDGPHTSIVIKFPLFDGDGNVYAIAGIVTDVTERRRLEAEVLQISEREQRRIAQDLHDGLGQHLTGIVHLAAVLQAKLAERALPEAADAARIVKLLDHAVTQTRSLARGLLPVQLEAGGLMSALEQLAAMVRDLFKIACSFECPQPVSMPDNVMATHLYRIAQEAINNAIKHGRASQIKIELVNALETITLRVQNNGLVFSKTRSFKDGIGLRIMRYRAEVIGGSLRFQSDAKRGTVVVCAIHQPPLSSNRSPAHEG
jgi:PAS domain S-box-containing protein